MMSDEDAWYDTLSKVKAYMDEHKSRPSSTSKDKEIKKLGLDCNQLTNYKKKRYIMKDEEIRLKWEEFVNDARYKEYFISYEDAWYNTLDKVKAYMDEHNCRPSQQVKIKRLKHWVNGLVIK